MKLQRLLNLLKVDSADDEQSDSEALTNADVKQIVTEQCKIIAEEHDADICLYSGDIERKTADRFVEAVDQKQRRPNLVLILTTNGGDADAAYIIARHIKRTYKKFILYVLGRCKSAGTLLALGADEIRMAHSGEFGPLDVQLVKDDEIGARSSGLTIQQALDSLQETAFGMFENYLVWLRVRSFFVLTTKTAAEIASSLTVGLLSPITAQIDPVRIGENNRENAVALDYGSRLCGNAMRVERLVYAYPSHSFVIDYEEAKEIFGNVHLFTGAERIAEVSLGAYAMLEFGDNYCIKPASDDPIIVYIDPFINDPETPEDPEEETSNDNPDEQENAKASPKSDIDTEPENQDRSTPSKESPPAPPNEGENSARSSRVSRKAK